MTVEVHIDTSKLKQVKQKMFNATASKQTAKLLEYAPLQLANAYNNRTFKNRTANLADSYVWAVYFMGKIQGSGYLWNNRAFRWNLQDYNHPTQNAHDIAPLVYLQLQTLCLLMHPLCLIYQVQYLQHD